MGMREKLIELLTHENSPLFMVFGDNVEGLADYLISNGVTIPVRCKDCKRWKPGDSFGGNSVDDMQRIGGCYLARCCRLENDFCSYGERRTDA